jgi:hypothetical protein
MKLTHAISHSGTGKMTVKVLNGLMAKVTENAPDSATVIFTANQDPREHDWYWSLNVTWETEA